MLVWHGMAWYGGVVWCDVYVLGRNRYELLWNAMSRHEALLIRSVDLKPCGMDAL